MNMLIVLKLLYAWLLPPGIFLVMLLAAWLCCRKTKAQRCILLLIVTIYLCSIYAVSDPVIKHLEDQYGQPPADQLKSARAIVVLGGGSYRGVRDFDGEGQISADAANRLFMGLRLHKALHLPIVLSGGQVFSYSATEADIEHRLLKASGVEEKFLIREDRSRNTAGNAKYTREICEQHRFDKVILVTSAYHMPRSVAFFKREGVDVIPYPTDYKTSKQPVLDAYSFTPSADSLYNTAIALKEYIGLLAVNMGWQ